MSRLARKPAARSLPRHQIHTVRPDELVEEDCHFHVVGRNGNGEARDVERDGVDAQGLELIQRGLVVGARGRILDGVEVFREIADAQAG